MSVYVRTSAGTTAALNPLIKLPRDLRQMLVAIDGATSASSFAARLGNTADVDTLLAELLNARLIRQVSVSDPLPTGGTSPYRAYTALAGRNVIGRSTSDDTFEYSNNVGNTGTVDITDFKDTSPDGRLPSGHVHYELGNVILLMADFVMQHLPEQSMEIVLALEGLTSKAKVRNSLESYRRLVAPLGDVASDHLADLQRMLDAA